MVRVPVRGIGRLTWCGAASLAIALAGCSETTPPAALLTLSVDPLPAVTKATLLDVTGRVEREPPARDLAITVDLRLGTLRLTDTAGPDGAYAFAVPLLLDSANEIRLTASDPAGSVGRNGVLIRQDNTPPRVLAVTPVGVDLVSPFTSIRFDLSEPVFFEDTPYVALSTDARPVPGTAVQSSDLLSVSFLPDRALASNRVYRVVLAAHRDRAGREAPALSACFVTRPNGSAVVEENAWVYHVEGATFFPYTAGDVRIQVDVDSLAVVAWSRTPLGVFGPVPVATAFLDLDTDHDATTGTRPARDTLLGGAWPSSGLGADHGIVVAFDSLGGTARAGPKLDPLTITPVADAQVTSCAGLLGFALPLDALGRPDSTVDWVAAIRWAHLTGVRIGGLPDSGAVHGIRR